MAAKTRIGIASIVATLLLSASPVLPALAQTTLDLPAQPLAQALKALAIQAGLDIYFDPPTVRGVQAPPVRATLSVQQALQQLLSGTHLHAIQVDAHTIRVVSELEFRQLQRRPTTPTDQQKPPPSDGTAAPVTLSSDPPDRSPDLPATDHEAAPARIVQLQEVFVTAERTRESEMDVPMSLTAITASQLESSHSYKLDDYIESVPGVSLINYGSLGNEVIIRGITSGSVPVNGAVAAYVDETPLTTEGPFADSIITTPDLDTFDMERIEVLRGPQGTLYGANSLGGVLRYITTPPDPSAFRSTVEAGVSSVSNGSVGHDVHAMVNLPLGSSAALRVVGYTNAYPGFIDDPSRGLEDTNSSRFSGSRVSLLILPLDSLSIRLNALYQDRNWNDYGNEDVAPGTLAPLYGALTEHELVNSSGTTLSKLYNATMKLDTAVAEILSTTSYYTLQPHALYGYSALNGVVASILGAPYTGAAVSFNEPVRSVTQEFRATSATRGPLHWIAGLYFTNEHGNEHEEILPVSAATNSAVYGFSPTLGTFLIPVQYREYAGYLNLDYQLSRTLDFAAGTRYSANHQTFAETALGTFGGGIDIANTSSENVLTYSGDLRWRFTPMQMLYARVSEGFAPGGPNDAFSGSSLPTSYTSSTTVNYEAGLKSSLLQNRLVAAISAYHIDWNKIQLVAVTNGFAGIVNGGSAKSNGFEGSLSYVPLHGVRISLDGAYTDARLTQNTPASVNGRSGDRLPGVPLWAGAAHAAYEHFLIGDYSAFAGLSWRFTGSRYSDFVAASPRQYLPRFGIFDAQAGVRSGTWSLMLYAKNLSNKIAINYVQPETLVGGLGPQAATMYTPRTVGASVTYNVP